MIVQQWVKQYEHRGTELKYRFFIKDEHGFFADKNRNKYITAVSETNKTVYKKESNETK